MNEELRQTSQTKVGAQRRPQDPAIQCLISRPRPASISVGICFYFETQPRCLLEEMQVYK